MEYSEFSVLLSRYGVDVAAISLVVAAISFVLKRTVFKARPRLAALAAYAAGVVIYAVYISIAEGDALFAFKNLAEVLESGLAIGTLATLICAALDKFLGGGSGPDAIEALIDGLVPDEKLEECAKELLAAIEKGADGLADTLARILAKYAVNADEEGIARAVQKICAAFGDADEETTTE